MADLNSTERRHAAIRLCTWLLALAGCCVSACAGARRGASALPSSQDVIDLASPRRLEVLPFTRPKSFDDDPVPDGVELTLRTLDRMGDPVKCWGSFHVELSHYRMASGDRHGERIKSWDVVIGSVKDQAVCWDRVTQTYRFQLGWQGAPLEPRKKYILDVTFEPPGGDRVFAEPYVFEFSPDIEGLRQGAKEASGGRK